MVKNKGQVMLLTTVIIGGLLLTASAIAGLLMLYQIRQSSDIINSTKAIFAADTGIEWRLYRWFQDDTYPEPSIDDLKTDFITTVFYDEEDGAIKSIKSIGTSGKSSRAFELSF